MIGRIIYISNNQAHIEVPADSKIATNLMNMHLIFEDDNRRVMGEVEDLDGQIIKVNFLGEIINNKFVTGVLQKPRLESSIRLIKPEEIELIIGDKNSDNMIIGDSSLYEGKKVRVNINSLFSNHLAILGNSGSGKSWGVARILQNVFNEPSFIPVKSNFLIFDAFGEYHNAFKTIQQKNPNYHFKYYTTNKNDTEGSILRIPIWLFDVDDMAILLNASSHSQLPIIERMIKLVRIFASDSQEAINYKNHLIAKAIMTILYTNQTSASKRNDIFSIIASCSTEKFNLEAPIQGIGYVRKFRDAFVIDTAGNFPESNLMTEYVSSFIDEKYEKYEINTLAYYTLEDLEKALDFTLISEGLLRNEEAYSEAITLKVRLHTIIISDYSDYLRYPEFVTLENFLAGVVSSSGGKAQIINFNLEDIDDTFAKTITKVFAKMLFTFTKRLKNRASIPFHLFLEEAHRYVQDDNDRFLIGYNIFERIAKEGRKYGLIFNLISQRPVEISETVISQISNFIIFKMTHPRDLEYIKKMLPNISSDIIEKQKSLQPGTCVSFGSAFKVPMIIKMEAPDPAPSSSNADIVNTWTIKAPIVPEEVPTSPVEHKTSLETVETIPIVQSQGEIRNENITNIISEPINEIENNN